VKNATQILIKGSLEGNLLPFKTSLLKRMGEVRHRIVSAPTQPMDSKNSHVTRFDESGQAEAKAKKEKLNEF